MMAVANPGADISPEKLGFSGRTAHSSHLWFDDSGKRLPIIYTYDKDFREKNIFEKVVQFWSDNTCLTFKSEPNSRCSKKHVSPAITLHSFKNYTVHRGIDKSKPCTAMSLGIGSREGVNKLLMNVLGMLSYTYRNDSSQYISMHVENLGFGASVNQQKVTWSELSKYYQCHGQTQVLPTPFDYLSKQMPYSFEFGYFEEARPVYVAQDPRHQYLLDYHWIAARAPTFYDTLVINTLYKCPTTWASECKTAVPKCKNNGYISKLCKCLCPPGFSGTTCENKIGPLFPLQPATFEVAVTADKTYDFSSLNIKPVELADADKNFRYYVFIIIRIAPKEPDHLPSISLFLPFSELEKTLVPLTYTLVLLLQMADCFSGMRLLWGSGPRLACDCLSSLVNNEPAEDARVFRGRRPHMGMTLINNLGRTFQKTRLTELTSQFRLTAQFRRPPVFTVAKSPDAAPVPVNTTGGGGGMGGSGSGIGAGNGSGIGGNGIGAGGGGNSSSGDGLLSGAASALTAAIGSGGGVGMLVALGVLLLVLLGIVLLFIHKCCKKRKKVEQMSDDEEEDGSETDSDDSDD